MPRPNSPYAKLVKALRADYPKLRLLEGDRFRYQAPNTIFYIKNPKQEKLTKNSNEAALYLLHEVGHYLIKQDDYKKDIELLKIESLAWKKAKSLCSSYGIIWDDDFAEDRLDSYRNWLHSRSLCPACGSTGFANENNSYRCPFCDYRWHSKKLPH